MTVNYGSLSFAEQIDFFRRKLNVTSVRWADVWREQHNTSFMIAGALRDDLLNDFRQAVDLAIAEGKSITWFKKEFDNIKKRYGWSHTGDAAWRSRVIYDTNMRQSYNAGRYEQLQHFDYWEYQHGDSLHPRELHLRWHGRILPKDDPWWQTHFPSNGWGCKCRVRGRSAQYIQRKGLTVEGSPRIEFKEWIDKVTGETHRIPKGIDPGFDYAPKKSTSQAVIQKQSTVKKAPYKSPERIVPSAFSTVSGADVHSLNAALIQFDTASDRVALLSQFLVKHDIKSLFIKQAEMGARNRAALKILPEVTEYLRLGQQTQFYYTTNKANRTNGFTWGTKSHVVIKVKSGTRFSKANFNDLSQAVKDAILLLREGSQQWSLSHIVRVASSSGDHGGAIVTWLHELGHQVHFKAGAPRIPIPYGYGVTEYSLVNDKEWHAEHFAMWLLNRDALASWDEGIAVYFDELIKKVI